MPVDDIDKFITPKELEMLARARLRDKKSSDKLIQKVAARAGAAAEAHNEAELEAEAQRAWPPKFLRGPNETR
jgi:hypothetical protein